MDIQRAYQFNFGALMKILKGFLTDGQYESVNFFNSNTVIDYITICYVVLKILTVIID